MYALTTSQVLYKSAFQGGGFVPFGYAVTAFAFDRAGNVYALTTSQILYRSAVQGGGFQPFLIISLIARATAIIDT